MPPDQRGQRGQQTQARSIVNPKTGQVLSPADIDAEILRMGSVLEEATEAYAEEAKQAAISEVEHKKAVAMSRMKKRVEGGHGPGGRATDAELEDQAVLEAFDLLKQRRLNEEIVRGRREQLVTLRTQIDYLRTLAANLRGQV